MGNRRLVVSRIALIQGNISKRVIGVFGSVIVIVNEDQPVDIPGLVMADINRNGLPVTGSGIMEVAVEMAGGFSSVNLEVFRSGRIIIIGFKADRPDFALDGRFIFEGQDGVFGDGVIKGEFFPCIAVHLDTVSALDDSNGSPVIL